MLEDKAPPAVLCIYNITYFPDIKELVHPNYKKQNKALVLFAKVWDLCVQPDTIEENGIGFSLWCAQHWNIQQ